MGFVSNIEEIRERARKKVQEGAVTDDYKLDRQQVISILNEALATEIVCTLRYRFHYFMASGIHSAAVAEEDAADGEEPRRLYFKDEVPGKSSAGEKTGKGGADDQSAKPQK